mgnify:FL=1
MKKSNILYIGNDFAKTSKYNSSMEVLSQLLISEGFVVYKTSKKSNKLARLFDMCKTIIIKRKVDYILIDTFSTLNFYYVLITSQLARIFKIKYILILRGGNLPYRINYSKTISNFIFKNSYKNVAPSNYLKIAFEKRNYKTIFIPNILDIDKYSFKNRKIIRPKILWVRAFRNLYNPTLAIEVLKLVKEQFPEASLCMVGPKHDNSFQDSIKLAEKYQLENSVEFTGILQKEEWHKKAKEFEIFIKTTNFDNTPVSVMEAMALGLVIISTNAGGMPYLIDNGINGILVDKENAEQMANQIFKVLKQQNIKLTVNAREKAETFGWNVVKNQWTELLNN